MSKPSDSTPPFVVGWEEWLTLPELGLPAIRAKIDTGAKTSALHAFEIETFGPAAAPMVRFGIHPIPGREDIARYCTATIVDRREITSSNGDREARFVIRTRLVMGGRDWGEIETTLANRESMAYRMLLGRQAIRGGMLVDPAASFLQPRLSHKLYAALPPQQLPPRRLRIALIATKPTRTSNLLLQSEAVRRGHSLDILPLDRLSLDFSGASMRLLTGSETVATYDSVIARATGGAPGLAAAVVLHLQRTGATALNEAGAIERLRNPYLVAMLMHANGLPVPEIADGEPRARILVVLGAAVATQGDDCQETQRLACRVAGALGLGMVAVEVVGAGTDICITGIDANPSLTGFGQAARLAGAIINALETRVRTPVASEGDA